MYCWQLKTDFDLKLQSNPLNIYWRSIDCSYVFFSYSQCAVAAFRREILHIFCLLHSSWMQLRYAQWEPEGPSVVEEQHSWLSNLPGCSRPPVITKQQPASFKGWQASALLLWHLFRLLYTLNKHNHCFLFLWFCDLQQKIEKTCIILVSQAQYYIPLVGSQSRWPR